MVEYSISLSTCISLSALHIGTCIKIGESRLKNVGESRLKNVTQIHANLYKNQPNIVQVKYNILTGFLIQGSDFLPIIGKLSDRNI